MSSYATTRTPLGSFTILVDDDQAVLAAGWTDEIGLLLPLVHPALRPTDPQPRRELGAVTAAVGALLDGDPAPAAATRVHQRGGEFTGELWAVMRGIRAGAPITYTELAARAGRPTATRAAAAACARNAAALFVPCHRVLRSSGGLGGFRWGMPVKARLLEIEAAGADLPRLSGV